MLCTGRPRHLCCRSACGRAGARGSNRCGSPPKTCFGRVALVAGVEVLGGYGMISGDRLQPGDVQALNGVPGAWYRRLSTRIYLQRAEVVEWLTAGNFGVAWRLTEESHAALRKEGEYEWRFIRRTENGALEMVSRPINNRTTVVRGILSARDRDSAERLKAVVVAAHGPQLGASAKKQEWVFGKHSRKLGESARVRGRRGVARLPCPPSRIDRAS